MNSSARTPGRAALAAAALTCLAALATGCASVSGTAAGSGSPVAAGGGGGSPSASASAVTLPSATSSPTAAGGASPTPAASGAQAGGAPGCATRDLGVKRGVSQGTAGSVYQVIVFTNISNVTCTLYGYPGVSLAAGTPVTQVGLAAKRTTGSPVGVITLAPGKSGNALLQIVDADNYPSATCEPVNATYLQIYPPNQTTPTYVSDSAKACAKPVQILMIGPMLSGTGGGS